MTEKSSSVEFSLIRGGPLYRLQEQLGLIPRGELAVARRALLFAAIAWLPVALGALVARRAFAGDVAEPLLAHYGIHARCLVAIPLFVIAQGSLDGTLRQLLGHLVSSGVADAHAPAFRAALGACEHLRDSIWGALVVLAAVALVALSGSGLDAHESAWADASAAASPALAFASGYYAYVSRLLFVGLGAAWIWRIGLLCFLFWRLSRLDLRLVAAHPDHKAGVAFLGRLPVGLLPVLLGLSVVLAARLGHGAVYHAEGIGSLRTVVIAWLAIANAVLVLPLLPFALRLARLRKTALLEYGTLVGRHARLFEARWLREQGDDAALIAAPEISAAADAQTVYASVTALRPLPMPTGDLMRYAALLALPFLPVAALEVPLKEVLKKIASIVM